MLLIIIGIAMIIIGGQAVVYSAKEIARMAGMTETLIGLTIVAVVDLAVLIVTSFLTLMYSRTSHRINRIEG